MKVSSLRRMANVLTNFLLSDITRNFESMVDNSGLTVLTDKMLISMDTLDG
jgi:hypothetical protein